MLIHNDNKKIKKTLKSRCLTFKINLSFDETIKISNLLLNENIFDLINNDLINYYAKPGDYINLINFSKKNQINLKEFSLKAIFTFIN